MASVGLRFPPGAPTGVLSAARHRGYACVRCFGAGLWTGAALVETAAVGSQTCSNVLHVARFLECLTDVSIFGCTGSHAANFCRCFAAASPLLCRLQDCLRTHGNRAFFNDVESKPHPNSFLHHTARRWDAVEPRSNNETVVMSPQVCCCGHRRLSPGRPSPWWATASSCGELFCR